MQTNYADGIISIALVPGNLVRMELGTIAQVENGKENQEVALRPTQHLVMSIEGFVRSFGVQEQVMQKLLTDGSVARRTPDAKALTV